MNDDAVIADILNHITLSNIRVDESTDKWKDIISEFFCQPDDGDNEAEDMLEASDDDFEPESVSVDVVKNVEMSNNVAITDDEDRELDKVRKFK